MCSVVRCDSWRRRAQRFILPEDPEKRLEWVQFLFEVNGQRLKESSWTDITVCSEHFTPNCFQTVAGTALLKFDAVPSVYQPDEPESKQDTIQPKDTACKHDQLKTCHSPTPGSSALNKEETSTLISVPASPASSEVSESSESDYCKMLQKIENLDIIKEKVALLQVNKRYVVNEEQLLRLFSAKCPLCQSKVKTEKVIRGVLLFLNQQCLQCDYSKQWKNLNDKSITEVSDDHQTEYREISLETISTDAKRVGITDVVQVVDKENDHTEKTDESSDPGEDSDDNWEPDDEPLTLISEEDSSCEEGHECAVLNHRELCTDCGMFFEIQKPHTCEYKIRPFPCNICGKRCVSEHALSVHSRVHNINYQHPCKYCHFGFKTKLDKITHEQTHLTQARPYKCPDCSETFATHKQRKGHLKSHTEQRQLKCPVCGIEFISALVLQRHSVVHTGEKPFRCSVCQRGFNQPGHLKSHMRLHTGERPYKCQHCNKCFNHNVSLKSHVQRCHTASGHQQKTARSRGCVDGDPLDNGGMASRTGDVDEDQVAVMEVSVKRSKYKKKTTGRPIGRPKKNLAVIEEEKGPGQGINTKTAKVRKRKPKRRNSSSEEGEEEMSKSEESSDLQEEEQQNEKVKFRQKAKDSDFDPTEIKKRRENNNNVCKNSRRPRGRQRKTAVC